MLLLVELLAAGPGARIRFCLHPRFCPAAPRPTALQGMQLSNKNRPGVWDLYLHIRQEPRWQGQWLAARTCECGGSGAGGSGGRVCPVVRLNRPMVEALLSEYYRQRYVFFDQGPPASSLDGSLDSSDGVGSSSSEGSLSGSMDAASGAAAVASGSGSRARSAPGAAFVWDAEGLAAAATMATTGHIESGAAADGTGGKRKRTMRPMLQGMDAQPGGYVEVRWGC